MVESGTSNRRNIIFVGLMLGMLVAATNQTIVSPAMPVIVAELGEIEHYSWIAPSTLLAVAVSVPVVGKLSDIYGRRGFYIGGLVIFMLGSILAGMAQGFWWLVAARAIQGLGMGTLQTLSLTILDDIVSPRERGKYMWDSSGSPFASTARSSRRTVSSSASPTDFHSGRPCASCWRRCGCCGSPGATTPSAGGATPCCWRCRGVSAP